jgi:uncharacterized protein YsxB (DUF464 family)
MAFLIVTAVKTSNLTHKTNVNFKGFNSFHVQLQSVTNEVLHVILGSAEISLATIFLEFKEQINIFVFSN